MLVVMNSFIYLSTSVEYSLINLRQSNIPLIVGADNYMALRKHRFFSGQLDDLRIYNRALTDAEVKALYEFEKAN